MRIEDNNFYNREDFNKDFPQLLVQLENQTVQDLYKKHIIRLINLQSFHYSTHIIRDMLNSISLIVLYKHSSKRLN